MPNHHPPHGTGRASGRQGIPFEPALSQLRALSARDLDRIGACWLEASGFRNVRCINRSAGFTTYETWVEGASLALRIHVRVFQRKNRLQEHHVDAFYGSLVRQGVSAGILVTTGGFSRQAVRLTPNLSPRVRVLAGVEWLSELAGVRAGVGRRTLRGWVVDLAAFLTQRRHARRKGAHALR